ncbi:MAG: hypothetical protein ABIS18_08575 [Actinomycetota bacterium]
MDQQKSEQTDLVGDVPFSTKLAFAAEFRVPRQHLQWAVNRINEPEWPYKQPFLQFVTLILPVFILTLVILNLIDPEPATFTWSILMVPVIMIGVGLLMALFTPDYVRGRTIRYQEKLRRRDRG